MPGNKRIEVTSIEEPVFGQEEKPRCIVAYRYKIDGQMEIGEKSGYRYYAIITSDIKMTPLQIIEHYNQRGCDGEHHFREPDYDFNWNKMPFDTFEMNTIYLYAMAVVYLLFNLVKGMLAAKLIFVEEAMLLKCLFFILSHFLSGG